MGKGLINQSILVIPGLFPAFGLCRRKNFNQIPESNIWARLKHISRFDDTHAIQDNQNATPEDPERHGLFNGLRLILDQVNPDTCLPLEAGTSWAPEDWFGHCLGTL